MPFVHGPTRLALPHHHADWATDLLTFEEAEWHLSRLSRIPGCCCMRYSEYRSRPHTRVSLPGGITKETAVARIMATLSADRPLGPDDFACHRCDNPECCHPDHVYAGTARSNGLDKFRRDRPIRERMAARFYDEHLLRIAEQPFSPWPLTPPKPKPLPRTAGRWLALDVPEHLKVPHPSVMSVPDRKAFRDLSPT